MPFSLVFDKYREVPVCARRFMLRLRIYAAALNAPRQTGIKQNTGILSNAGAISGPPGARTLDTLIKSQVLYQLS
jgi:hypothetical protein